MVSVGGFCTSGVIWIFSFLLLRNPILAPLRWTEHQTIFVSKLHLWSRVFSNSIAQEPSSAWDSFAVQSVILTGNFHCSQMILPSSALNLTWRITYNLTFQCDNILYYTHDLSNCRTDEALVKNKISMETLIVIPIACYAFWKKKKWYKIWWHLDIGVMSIEHAVVDFYSFTFIWMENDPVERRLSSEDLSDFDANLNDDDCLISVKRELP